MESSPPLSACARVQPRLARLTRCAGDEERATIDDAVRLLRTADPPLAGQPLCLCLQTLTEVTMKSESAWAYAERAGAYEGVVRSADAHPDDVEVQLLVCAGLPSLGMQQNSIFWPGHMAAGERAGAVRVVAGALRKHGVRSMSVFTAATALVTLLDDEGADWEDARSGHVGMALAAGFAVALRDTTGEAERVDCAPFIVRALTALGRDALCAQEAAKAGALLSIAEFLHAGCALPLSAYQAFTAMQRIASHAPAAVRARAADAGVTALRFALGLHPHLNLQHAGWHAVLALLAKDAGAQSRAVAAGIMADMVRTMEDSVSGAADEEAMMGAEGACRVLQALTTSRLEPSHTGHREAAGAAGAVAAVIAVLRQHGCAHSRAGSAACYALAGIVYHNVPNTRAALRARPFADVVAVMRVHSTDGRTTMSAALSLGTLVAAHFMMLEFDTGATLGEPAAFSKELAEAGVLEVATRAILEHTGPEYSLMGHKCVELLVATCTGALPTEDGQSLQPHVAARAKRAGVEAALSAALARALQLQLLPSVRAAAERLLAALAKVRVCDGCGTTEAPKLMRCSRCLAARFCGQACMRSSWPVHKLVCTPVAAASDE
jgi:hypothetical protein